MFWNSLSRVLPFSSFFAPSLLLIFLPHSSFSLPLSSFSSLSPLDFAPFLLFFCSLFPLDFPPSLLLILLPLSSQSLQSIQNFQKTKSLSHKPLAISHKPICLDSLVVLDILEKSPSLFPFFLPLSSRAFLSPANFPVIPELPGNQIVKP